MRRIGLAWDLGAGRGHAVRLATLARRVRERGDVPVLFARNLRTLRAAFAPGDVPMLLPAPHNDWVPRDVAPASWADILWSEAGLHDEAQAVAIAVAWRDVLAASGVEALFADAAPLAAPAAAALGLPCVAIGTGFLTPPAGPPWPVFRTWEGVDSARLAARESTLAARLQAVRDALAPREPSANGAQRVAVDASPAVSAHALFTYPALDHYPQRDPGGVHYVGPLLGRGAVPRWPAGARRVFVYLPATHAALDALDTALRGVGALAVLAHFAGARPWQARAGLEIAEAPVDVAHALREADLVVTAGGNLAVAAAAHGVPALLLPTQAEAFLTARRLDALGAAVACTDAGTLPAALAAALDEATARAARALGATLPVRDDDAIADAVLDLCR